MVFHTKYNKYREELPIGAARRRVIAEIFYREVANIIAAYSMMTPEDRLNILCSGMSGSFKLPQNIYSKNWRTYNTYITWKPRSPNSKKKMFQLRNLRNVSKQFPIDVVLYDYNDVHRQDPIHIWDSRDSLKKQLKEFFVNAEEFREFYDIFNTCLAKIL